MHHRRSTPPPGGRRWLAGVSVVVMVASAAVLTSVLLDRVPQDRVMRPVEVRGPLSHAEVPVPHPRPAAGARPRRDVRTPAPGGDGWRGVLADLDRRRSRAYAAADPRLLREVYTPGSRALRQDRELLLRYRRRGLRVLGLRMRVVDLRAGARDRGRVVIRVRERVVAGTVVGADARHRLPADRLDTSAVTLRRVGAHGWRVSSVRPARLSAAP